MSILEKQTGVDGRGMIGEKFHEDTHTSGFVGGGSSRGGPASGSECGGSVGGT